MFRNTWNPIPGSGKTAGGFKNKKTPGIRMSKVRSVRINRWVLSFDKSIKIYMM